MEQLVDILAYSISATDAWAEKEVKKKQLPVCSTLAGVMLANILNFLLATLDMWDEDRVIAIADTIRENALRIRTRSKESTQ